MAWPERPQSLSELPALERSYVDLESMTPGLSESLVSFASTFQEDLEGLTAGDPEKEKLLGSLIIKDGVYGRGAGRQEVRSREMERRSRA